MGKFGNIGFGSADVFVPEKSCFAYFSFLRKLGKASLSASPSTVFITDFDENPIHQQLPLALRYLENLTYLRSATLDKTYIFSNSYFSDIKEFVNHPEHLRKKKLLILDVHLKDIEQSEIKKILRSKYEIATPERYYQILASADPQYALLTGRYTRLGYLVTVFDLELGRMVYGKFGWGNHLKDSHLEDLEDAIRKG